MTVSGNDSLNVRRTLTVNGANYDYFSLTVADDVLPGDTNRLPYSLKVLLENLLRYEDGRTVSVNDIKAAAWDRFHTDNESSLHIIRAAMQGFFWVHQESIVTKYVDRYFEQVRIIFETRDKDFASAYFHSLYPSHSPSTDVVKKTQSLISTLRPDETLLYRSLREAQDELERTIACRQYDEN